MAAEGKHRAKSDRPPQTCDICKLRHQKCNSVRPSCYYCQLRGLQCKYSTTQAHKIDQSVVRRKSVPSEPQPSPAVSPKRVEDTPAVPEMAQDYLGVHRIVTTEIANLDLTPDKKEELARSIAEKVIKRPDPIGLPHMLQSNRSFAYEATTDYYVRHLARLWAKELGRDPTLVLEAIAAENRDGLNMPAMPMPALSRFSPGRLHNILPPKEHARRWLMIFLNGPNKLFRICDPLESQQLLDALYSSEDGIDRIPKCLILFQLATGARFTEDTNEHIYTAIYDSAWALLDECLEREEGVLLWMVPALLVSCVYAINLHPKTCWLTLGIAIRVAQINRIDLGRESCRHMSDSDYARWRQVWEAIIFLDAWLALELGRMPQVNENTTQDPFIRHIWTDMRNPVQELHVNMTKLAVMVSKFLIEAYGTNEKAYLNTYERYLHALEEWSSSLPQSLRYFPDHANSGSSVNLSIEDEIASHYLEAFYLSCVLFLTRPLLLYVMTVREDQEASTIPLRLRFFAQTCLDSAIQLGHVSLRMVNREFICKRSWLITTLNYHAGLVLALNLSMKGSRSRWNLTAAQERTRRQVEKGGLDVAMSVLSYCATKDPYSTRFLKTIKVFKGMIEAQEVSAFAQSGDFSMGWNNPDPMELRPPLTSHSTLSSEPASYSSFTGPSTTSPSSLELRPYPTTSSMSGTDYVEVTHASNPFLTATTLQSDYFADPNPLFLNWSQSNPLSYHGGMETGMDDHAAQMRMPPQHFQTFLHDFSQSQDARLQEQSQMHGFGTI